MSKSLQYNPIFKSFNTTTRENVKCFPFIKNITKMLHVFTTWPSLNPKVILDVKNVLELIQRVVQSNFSDPFIHTPSVFNCNEAFCPQDGGMRPSIIQNLKFSITRSWSSMSSSCSLHEFPLLRWRGCDFKSVNWFGSALKKILQSCFHSCLSTRF